jgi:hypothetical protein
MLPPSAFDGIMGRAMIPALEAVFGIPATHTNADDDEVPVTVMLGRDLMPVGEYGERMEMRETLEIAASSGAWVGQTFAVAVAPTEDDPDPDPVVYTATQLLADDGYLRRFAVLKS